MMKFVIISLNDKSIEFDACKTLTDEFYLHLNTNKNMSNKFYYDYRYFKINLNKIIKRVKDEFFKLHIDTLVIKSVFISNILILNLNSIGVPNLDVSIEESLTIEEYEKITNYKNLKKLICYYIPPIYRKKLENKKIEYTSLYNEFISDKFMLNNDCIDHDTLYYKKNIALKDYSEQTLKDLNEFLKLNHNLKVIHLYSYSNEFILKLIDMLKKWNEHNVIIYLYQNYDFDNYLKENLKKLRKINKKYYKVLHGDLRIKYSKQYIIKNLFKQLSFNNLKVMLIIIGYVALVSLFFNEFNTYLANNNMNELSDSLGQPVEENNEVENNSKYNFEQIFSKLLKINNETVGWIIVNGTNINYPVVKHSDNDYYLHRDFYKTKTSHGWIFMDYRNNVENLNDNTIIYGHRLKNETMFGNLDLALNKNWYTNPDNLEITFNSVNENMKWQVFSIYSVNYTIDYLKTNFSNEEDFNKFIDLISRRSVYNFGVSLNYGDKILTLSTCASGNNRRMAIHAKLIKE